MIKKCSDFAQSVLVGVCDLARAPGAVVPWLTSSTWEQVSVEYRTCQGSDCLSVFGLLSVSMQTTE